MAPLTGKMVSKTKIESGGDVFHELWSSNPHHVPNISPAKVQGCDLHEGEFGKAGSIVCWRYVHGNNLIFTIFPHLILRFFRKRTDLVSHLNTCSSNKTIWYMFTILNFTNLWKCSYKIQKYACVLRKCVLCPWKNIPRSILSTII